MSGSKNHTLTLPLGTVIAVSEVQVDYMMHFVELFRQGKYRTAQPTLQATRRDDFLDALSRVPQDSGALAKRNDRSSPPRRRTQVERSSLTRAKLLGATVRSLIEVGYARTTTIDVSERAGLSRGAQLHHFPSKADLLIAAVDYLADERTRRVLKDLRTRPAEGPVSLATVFDLLWTTFTGPLFWAGLELMVAARTDAELRAKLPALEKRLSGRVYEAIEKLTGTQGGAAKDAMELTLYVMRGMALERIISEDDTHMRELLGIWRKLVESMLATPHAKSAGGKRRASRRAAG